MKKVLFLFFALVISANTLAQNEHMSFLGLPIQGSLLDFSNKLVDKGFTIDPNNNYSQNEQLIPMETIKLKGDFETFKDCEIYVRLMKDSLDEISSIYINIDTTEHNKKQLDKLIYQYDSIYGKHIGIDNDDAYWDFKEGRFSINKDEKGFNIAIINTDEVLIRDRKYRSVLFEAFKKGFEEEIEKERVKEICGIPFGTSYSEASRRLQNKYGESDYFSDKEKIIYKNKTYAGISFDVIYFLFESDGLSSFMNGCTFILNAKSLKEARTKLKMLHDKLEKKYTLSEDKDDRGESCYAGGFSPLDNKYAFTIDILKYEGDIAKNYSPYSVRLMYGRYSYVKEEF